LPNATIDSYDRLVEDLGVPHREKQALRGLMFAGTLATPAVRRGLRHANPVVRVACCKILDHFLDEAAIPDLIANLNHEDDQVRSWALHALACDRCKEGVCRPGEGDVIPLVTRMLFDDPSRWVRKQAAQLLGQSAHRRADVCQALEVARDNDPDPLVRKVARWYTPGGPIYRRLVPAPPGSPGQKPLRRPRPGSLLPRPLPKQLSAYSKGEG
jgi:HEAT repeat protein